MSNMVIVGCGLVSPLGLSVTEHAFYFCASVGAPPPPAFETADGERVEARHCGFLGALGGGAGQAFGRPGSLSAPLSVAERLSRLSEIAAHQALHRWQAAGGAGQAALAFVAPCRAGVPATAVAEARSTVARLCRAPLAQTFSDAAGAFAALEEARGWLAADRAQAVLILGVDSFVCPEALAEDLERAESPFCPRRPPPSEGAAAVLLVRAEQARALGLAGARVHASGTAIGRGNDEDDAILDGAAMTALLRALPARRIDLVVGQEKVDDLRARDWYLARARAGSRAPISAARGASPIRFADDVEAVTLEDETGRLGAAAGVASLAFGAGALEHRIFRDLPSEACLLAWAISRDGTRGVALITHSEGTPATSHAPRALTAAHDGPALRGVEREPIQIPDAPPSEPDDLIDTAPAERGEDLEADHEMKPAAGEGYTAATPPPLDVVGVLGDAANETGLPANPTGDAGAPVRRAKGKGAPLPLTVTRAEIVSACLDGIALAARHRAHLPRSSRAGEEQRILAFVDALVSTPRFTSSLAAWWDEAAGLPDPWRVWAPTFVLACLDGDDLPDALAGLWRRLPDEDAESAAIAGEALALGAHPERLRWARGLAESAHAIVRAAALKALSLEKALSSDELVRVLETSTERAVRWVALGAAARLPEDRRLAELLIAELHRATDGELAWQAARALSLWGSTAAYDAMRRDPALLYRLGPRALDLLALLGDGHDAPLARQIIARCGLTSEVLRGLGRYGHPGAAPALVRALGDEDAAGDASEALTFIFGLPFGEEKAAAPDIWRAWLRTAALDEAVRYRFGKPYRPGCVAEVAALGESSQLDVAWLVDEANVRAGLAERPELWRWSPAAEASLAPALAAFARESSAFATDSWRSAPRLQWRGPDALGPAGRREGGS
jgi:hypothetical protein